MRSPVFGEILFGALISINGRGQFVFLNDRLRPPGLSAGQFLVLMLLYKKQNIMQETLVRHYHLDKGTIARSVRKLKNAGYIRGVIDPDNRRAVRLFHKKKARGQRPSCRVSTGNGKNGYALVFPMGIRSPSGP